VSHAGNTLENQSVVNKTKRKVVLLDYSGNLAGPIRKQLESKACKEEIELIVAPKNLSAMEAGKKISAMKLPPGSLVITAGHAQGTSLQGYFDSHPELKNKSESEIKALWKADLASGKAHSLAVSRTMGTKTLDLRDAILKAAPGSSVWLHSCKAGGVCGASCIGATCAFDEFTYSDEEPSLPDQALIHLLCDEALRKNTDSNKNGILEQKELSNYFQCDAAKYPMTYMTRFILPKNETKKQEFLAKAKTESHRMLREYLTKRDTTGLDPYEVQRIKRIQATYPELKDVTLKEMEPLVTFSDAIVGNEFRITATLPEPKSKKSACYWEWVIQEDRAMPMTPTLGNDFRITVQPGHK
jgi:hypothetical protein